MTPSRLAAIVLIYAGTVLAWIVLGGTIVNRTGESDSRLGMEVARLWGGRHQQAPPVATLERPREVVEEVAAKDGAPAQKVKRTVIDDVPLALSQGRVEVALALDQRRKGLLWYDTYGVDYAARYRLANPDPVARVVRVDFAFPSPLAIYDGFAFEVNGEPAPAANDLAKGLGHRVVLPPNGEALVRIAYRSRGLGDWTYALAPSGVAQVRDFELQMKTDFAAIDYPSGTLSPTRATRAGAGWDLLWHFDSLVTGQSIGMDAPGRLNPGPLAARLTFFAPVSLLFFLTVMVILGVLAGRSLHPMNYFFLSAAFFAFHLLLAYLVDHLDIHAAFAIAAAVSVFLVTSYLRVVAGMRRALWQAGLAQAFFLVLFSYAFFFEGYTGLTVSIGAVVTLFVMMQATARVDWAAVFEGGAGMAGRQS
jgi:hypothetical protein